METGLTEEEDTRDKKDMGGGGKVRGCLYLSWEIKGVVANLDQGLLHPWVLLRDCRTNTSRKEAPAQGSRYNTAPNILGKEQISHQTVDP